jgi:betaine-homocysteine S-methyltransferase
VRTARKVAGDELLVAGNISLTWMYDDGGPEARARVLDTFAEQLDVQVAEGVDFVIGETFSWLGEALLAVEAIKKTGLPAMVTLSFEQEPRTMEGKSPGDAARALADAGADIVGVNCLRSPYHTLPIAEEMRQAVGGYLATQPVAYRTTDETPDFTSMPQFPTQLDPLQLSRGEMADYARRARDIGVNFIGACCGAVPTHIREMGRALGKVGVDERLWKRGGDKPMSAVEYYDHKN